jgi:hypothetical protein
MMYFLVVLTLNKKIKNSYKNIKITLIFVSTNKRENNHENTNS